MVHPAQPNVSRPVHWLQNIAILMVFFAGVIVFVFWFSTLPTYSNPVVMRSGLELSLSGAIGTKIVLTQEDIAKTLTCNDEKIQFALPATKELYGLTWLFEMPEGLTRSTVFTLGSTFPLSLSLTNQAGAYRTFRATEGELSFDPESRRGYFTAFLYDGNGEGVFASAAWQCL